MYGLIANRGVELIEKLWRETDSKNPGVRIAALRTLINKILPDITSKELVGKNGEELPTPIIQIFSGLKDVQSNDSNKQDSIAEKED